MSDGGAAAHCRKATSPDRAPAGGIDRESLRFLTCDLVITDLNRKGSSDRSETAGADLLEQPIVRDGGPPVVIYAGRWAVARRDDLVRRGALDVMANREHLFAIVLEVLGRGPEPTADLER